MDVFTPAGLIKDQRILTCITYNIFQVRLVMQATQRSTSELTLIWIGMCPYSWLKGPVFFLKKHFDFHDQDRHTINRFKGNIGNHFVDNFEKLFRLYA